MNNKIKPLPQDSTPVSILLLTNWSKILLFIVLELIIVSVAVFIGIQIGKNQKSNLLEQPTTPFIQPEISPKPSPIMEVNPKTGWYILKTSTYQIEFPQDWHIDEFGNITKSFSIKEEPIHQCGKMCQAQIFLTTNDHYRDEELWGELFTVENFYNLNNPSWKGLFKSGGGGINKDTLSLSVVGSQKAIKFTRIWTDVIECWPKTETKFFLMNPLQNSSDLLVTQIEYEIKTDFSEAIQMKTEIEKIISTFKFVN